MALWTPLKLVRKKVQMFVLSRPQLKFCGLLSLPHTYGCVNHYSGRFWRWAFEEITPFFHVCSLSLKSQFPHCHFYFYSNNEWKMISFFSKLFGFIFFIYTSFSLFLIIFFYCNFIFFCQCFVYSLPAHSSAFVCYGSF